MEEWQHQSPQSPGCKIIWLDEFLTSQEQSAVMVRYLKYLANEVRKTYPPERLVTADSIKVVADFVEEISQATNSSGVAPQEWRPNQS